MGRADPGKKMPARQYLHRYSFYREGWGRTYYDDCAFSNRDLSCQSRDPRSAQRFTYGDDPDLQIHRRRR